jgi:hypothetical protein
VHFAWWYEKGSQANVGKVKKKKSKIIIYAGLCDMKLLVCLKKHAMKEHMGC